MGRPLYSTLLATRRATEEVATQLPPPVTSAAQTECPVIEKWSRWNSFDPDSDEFFQADDAVYEAFLTEEEVIARDEAQRLDRGRRVTPLRPETFNDGQRIAGLWVEGDNNLVASPRPMSIILDGLEASAEAQPMQPPPRNPGDGDDQAAPSVRAAPSTLLQNIVSGNRVLEPPQPIPTTPPSHSVSPVLTRVSGLFSPRRRSTIGLGSIVDPPISRHVDIRVIPAPEPLTS